MALRAAVCVAVPLLILWGIDRLDVSVFATFGAFTALYGRFDALRDRLAMQTAAGATIVVTMVIATALAAANSPVLVRIAFVTLVAGVVTLVATAARWHPPGALFGVFAAGACSALPATWATVGIAALVGGASAVFSLAVTLLIGAARMFTDRHHTNRTDHAAPATADPQPLVNTKTGPRPALLTVSTSTLSAVNRSRWASLRRPALTAAAVGIAGLTALALVGTHWYWAMVAAVAALSGAHLLAQLTRALQRLVGTLLGVALAAGILSLHLPPLAVIAVVVVCQAGAELFVGRNYAITMVFVTPLALLMIELAAPSDPLVLLRDRTIDTLIGVIVGVAVAVLGGVLLRQRASRT